MTIFKKSIALFAAVAVFSANADISFSKDDFNGTKWMNSTVFRTYSLLSLKFDDVTPNPVNPFSYVNLYKRQNTDGTVYNMLFFKLDSTTYGYFGSDTAAQLKVDDTIIDLPRTSFLSHPKIDEIYIYADQLFYFLKNGGTHKISLRLSGAQGTFTLNVTEPLMKEWILLSKMDINDAELVGATPISGSFEVIGKKATGWVFDPKNSYHKPEIHVYRGSQMIKSIKADITNCTSASKNTCAKTTAPKVNWNTFAYELNLEDAAGTSMEPLKLYAINYKQGQPNVEIASKNLILRDDIECVYNWLEKYIPREIIPESARTFDEANHRVRRYSNGSMVGTAFGSGEFGYQIQGGPFTPSGNLRDYLATAIEQNCGE